MTRRNTTILLLVVLAIVVGLFLFFRLSNKKPTIGILSSTSYTYPNERAGILIALKSLPKGVNFVNVDYSDDNIGSAFEGAVKRGIRYFVGLNTSSDAKKIEGLLSKTHSILIEDQVTDPQVVEASKNLYTMAQTDNLQAQAIAAYIDHEGYKTITIVKSNSNAAYVNYLSNKIERDLSGVKTEIISISQLSSVQRAPDAFVLVMSAQEAVDSMKELESKFGRIPFVGSDWTFRGDTLMRNIKVSEGMVTIEFVNLNDVSSSFRSKMFDLDLQVTPTAILAHDAVMVAYALAKNRISPKRVYSFLQSHIFIGERGDFSFRGKCVNSPIYFYKVSPLNFKLVWTFGGKR